MLNDNEKEILNAIQDKEYMSCISANFNDIKNAINFGIKEFNELENIVKVASKNKESFQNLCQRLQGHNEVFNEKYPNYNYFDLNYKSLLVTVKEKLNKDNDFSQFTVLKTGVYIYPDNISTISADEICILDLDQEIDFEKIYKKLENNVEENTI